MQPLTKQELRDFRERVRDTAKHYQMDGNPMVADGYYSLEDALDDVICTFPEEGD